MKKRRAYLRVTVRRVLGALICLQLFLSRLFKKFPSRVEKILVVNLFGIGDVTMSTPALRAIRKKYPSAYLSVVVRESARDVLAYNPNVDELLVYDDKEYRGVRGKIKLARLLRKEQFGLAVAPFSGLANTWVAYLSGAPYKVGYLCSARVGANFHLPKELRAKHYFGAYPVTMGLAVAKALGCEAEGDWLDFHISKDDQESIDEFLSSKGFGQGKRIISLNPGTTWPSRTWLPAKWAQVGDEIARRIGLAIIITGGPEDAPVAEEVAALMKTNSLVTAGQTTVGQLAALLEKLDLFITSDAGPMHVARAVGTPVVALFGPLNPRERLPEDEKNVVIWKELDCSPCFSGEYEPLCDDFKCMEAITVQEVVAAAEKLLRKKIKRET